MNGENQSVTQGDVGNSGGFYNIVCGRLSFFFNLKASCAAELSVFIIGFVRTVHSL